MLGATARGLATCRVLLGQNFESCRVAQASRFGLGHAGFVVGG